MPSNLVKIAKILGAHSLRGEVKLLTYSAAPEAFGQYSPLQDAEGKTYSFEITGKGTRDAVIAHFDGINDRNAAEALKGLELYVDAAKLPVLKDNEFYLNDLIGLTVLDEKDALLGEVIAVHNFGAGDIVEVKFVDGKEEMFPFKDAFFPKVDKEKRMISLHLPEEEV